MKISSCLIVRDSEDHIEDLIIQLLAFSEEICIFDTGSIDNTKSIIEQLSRKYPIKYEFGIWEYDFSKARNKAFSMATSDWIFWCDADDTISEELSNELKNLIPKASDNSFRLRYEFCPGYFHDRYSLIRRDIFDYWEEPVHEFIVAKEDLTLKLLNGTIIHSHRNGVHNKRNLDIYLRALSSLEYSFNCRSLCHYSNELMDNGYPNKAFEIYKKIYPVMDVDSKFMILQNMFQCLASAKLDPNELIPFMKTQDRGDIKYLLGCLYEILGDDKSAASYYEQALLYKVKGDECFFSNDHVGILPSLSLVCIYDRAGDYDTAFKYHQMCEVLSPNHASVINNRIYFKNLHENVQNKG